MKNVEIGWISIKRQVDCGLWRESWRLIRRPQYIVQNVMMDLRGVGKSASICEVLVRLAQRYADGRREDKGDARMVDVDILAGHLL